MSVARSQRRLSRPIGRSLHVESLEDRRLLAVGPQEQLFIYLLNRARHDPAAYQQEAGISVDLSGVAPRMPLAVNDDLSDSAQFHVNDMSTAPYYFAHQSAHTGEWPNEMARDQGYVLDSSWSNDANYIESIVAGTNISTAALALSTLIVDEGVAGAGHRVHLLSTDDFNAGNREIGVGYNVNNSATYRNYWAIHATRTSTSDRFLTGVVFNDTNSNGRYDLNEGLPNVTVSTGSLTDTTNASGGWAIKVPAGTYTVTASGGGFSGTSQATATVSNNVEVDFISGRAQGFVDFETPPANDVTNTVGLFDPTGSAFYLRNSNTAGVANTTFAYGPANAGWQAISGDWDANGVATIGLYNQATGVFYLRNSLSSGVADLTFAFGPADAGLVAIAGDWNGNGQDTIGLYSPTTGAFFLRNTNNAGVADVAFQFGPANSGWQPIAGDWDGLNNTDTVGLYSPAGGAFFLRNAHAGGNADVSFGYGPANAGWLPLSGDWDGNGTDTIALYSRASGTFFQRNTNTAGIADAAFAYGPGGTSWVPLAGDWNGPSGSSQAVAGLVALAGPDSPDTASRIAEAREKIREALARFAPGPTQPIIDLVFDYQEDVQNLIDTSDRNSLASQIRERTKTLASNIRTASENLRDQLLAMQQDWLDRS